MTAAASSPQLGFGIYTIPDVAQILGLPAVRLRHLVNEYWDGRFGKSADFSYSWGERKDRAVNFYALIEFYTWYQLRKLGVQSPRIILAHEAMSELLQTPFPFANARMLTDGKNILFTQNGIDILNADRSRQFNLKEVIEHFCTKIDYDTDQMAQKFWPEGRQNSIVIDPGHQFGQPVIKGTNVRADVLNQMHRAGDSIRFIANVYELPEKAVRDAVHFAERKAA